MIRGLAYMLVASTLFAVMGVAVYQVKKWNPDESAVMASFIRILINFVFVLLIARWTKDAKGNVLGIKGLFGDFRWSLWMRGLFGTLAIMSSFYAMHAIGIGESSFLNSSHAVWVGLLGPFVIGQPNSRLGWLAILIGMVGLYLLYQPHFEVDGFMGRTMGLASGFFAATAYMMISRAGRSNHPLTIVFYFMLVSTIIHLVWFLFSAPVWPTSEKAWLALSVAGISASFAQIFMTKAYQEAPAALVSAVSYANPVISLCFAMILFREIPNTHALIGAAIVVLSGVALPFVQTHRALKLDKNRVPEEVTS